MLASTHSQQKIAELFVLYKQLSLSDEELKINLSVFSLLDWQEWLTERVCAAAIKSDLDFLMVLARSGEARRDALVRTYIEAFVAAHGAPIKDAALRRQLLRQLTNGWSALWLLAAAVDLAPRHLWSVWRKLLRNASSGYYFPAGLGAALSSPTALDLLAHLEVNREEWTAALHPLLLPPVNSNSRSHAGNTRWSQFLESLPLTLLASLRDIEEGAHDVIPLALPQHWRDAIAARMSSAITAPAFWSSVVTLLPADAAWLLRFVEQTTLETTISTFSGEQVLPLMQREEPLLSAPLQAWLDAHLTELSRNDQVLLAASMHGEPQIRHRALERLRRIGLDVPVSLRLYESGLPELQQMARTFFEADGDDWTRSTLALCDSPAKDARSYGLELLQRFPARWTDDLLQQLVQHDDAKVQAFVAARLENNEGARQTIEGKAIENFDRTVLNGRGRARRAKERVKSRLSAPRQSRTDVEPAPRTEIDSETLREAARNGAVRDREWALSQLVRAALKGEEIDGVVLRGAVATASHTAN